MSYNQFPANYSLKNITNPYWAPPLQNNMVNSVFRSLQNNGQRSIVSNSVKYIVPPRVDNSRAYAPVDLAGLNTSDQKVPDFMILDKNPMLLSPQKPFFVQTGL